MFVAMSVTVFATAMAQAQTPSHGIGRTPTPEEIARWDIAVGPDGLELPDGRGNAVEGKEVYAARCVTCHGATGNEGPEDILYGGADTLESVPPLKTVGSYWPYATTLWDYVNRAMPFDRPTSLSNDSVYAVVAYVLFINGIIEETEFLDSDTLPRIRMPNRDGFVPDPRPDVTVPVETLPSPSPTIEP
jgi:mono/diheme cytochrome c family protein